MMSEKIKVLLDCDTGSDDAFAIALALASDKVEVLGLTTVAGNYTLPDVLLNTRRCLSITDPSLPYAVGYSAPQARELHTHGRPTHMMEGLGDPQISPVSEDAVEFMAEKIKSAGGPVTLIPLGPLTNIAALLRKYPEVKSMITEMVIMGGAVYTGNVTANSEFNIFVDPEAAKEVFESGVHMVMFGIEGCFGAYFTEQDGKELAALGSKTAKFYGEEIVKEAATSMSWAGYPRTCIFDAATMLWFENRNALHCRDSYVNVIAGKGTDMDGCTFVDFRPETWDGHKANTTVVMEVDPSAFKEMVMRLFATYK